MKNEYQTFGEYTAVYMCTGILCVISTVSLGIILPYTWCLDGNGYVMSRTFGKTVKLHRLIMNAGVNEYVDHIDGNPLNNTLDNLRICKKQQNEFNSKLRSDSSSGYKGVSYRKDRHYYRSYINKDGKQYHLGNYNTKEEAARAYNQKAIELFGEYARLNDV